jgi:hypothetical protein
LGYQAQLKRKRTAEMYHTTGFTKDQIVELCALISAVKVEETAVVRRRFWGCSIRSSSP